MDNEKVPECLETPTKHEQVDGKNNNVSFKTTRTDVWKNSIIDYFGISITNVQSQKTGKVTSDLNNQRNSSVKVNLFYSGAVVIQGAKCSKFTEFFSIY
jgi:hypothetical protein